MLIKILFQKPIKEVVEKKISSVFGKSGILSFKVDVSRSGYVPGENIIINAECENTSGRKMTHIRAEILQVFKF